MEEPGNPIALLQKIVYGTGLPEAMSESSELMMQCDEEDLDPWQNGGDDAKSDGNKSTGSKANKEPSTSAGTPAASTAAEVPTECKNAALPVVSATALPAGPALMPMQPLQVAPNMTQGGGTPGQPIFLSTPSIPVSSPVGTTIGKTIGFILNGQTYLSAGTGHQLIAPKMMSPVQTPLQVPVTLTITGPSGIQTISAMATAGLQQLNLAPSGLVTTATPPTVATAPTVGTPVAGVTTLPAVPTSVATASAAPASQQPPAPAPSPLPSASPSLSPSPAISPAPVLRRSPQTAPVAASRSTTVKAWRATTAAPVVPPPPAPPSLATPSTSTFQLRVPSSHSKASKSCSRCRSAYKMVAPLRAYMCMCNKALTKAVQKLDSTKKKKKILSVSAPKIKKVVIAKTPSKSSPALLQGRRFAPSSSEDDEEEEEEEEEDGDRYGNPYDVGGKLIMLVEEFYYGLDRGAEVEKTRPENALMFKCHLCDKTLKNNLKMMVHTKHHVEMDQDNEAQTQTTCQHCFRNFASPLSLQYHVESVHSQAESSTKCRICELAYENEPIFLQHMKNTHKPGEMPYICQVCGFRSSFYLDVIFHFRDVHSNTTHLLCPYCLKVFRSSSNYQLHYSRHQKKSVLHCEKCRLQFLFVKDRAEHLHLHHNTHRKPRQLEGLKPGTRVTIRTYAAVPSMPKQLPYSGVSKPQVIEVSSVPPQAEPRHTRLPTPTRSRTPNSSPVFSKPSTPTRAQAAIKKPKDMSPPSNTLLTPHPTPCSTPLPVPSRKIPSVSLSELMAKFDGQSATLEKGSCVECTFEIPNYSQHFPTYVHCSLCRYSTCCSRSYANHMINNHVSRRTGNLSKYLSMFRPCPRDILLHCLSCPYTTQMGDMMANHLVENPDHYGSSFKSAGFATGFKRFVIIPNEVLKNGQTAAEAALNALGSKHPSKPEQSPAGKSARAKKLMADIEAKIKKEPDTSLTVEQLKIVLFALCCGLPQAGAQFNTPPALIQSWLIDRKQQGPSKGRRGLGPRAADRLSEWVLAQREQQLPVNEEKLFQKAKECVGGSDPGLSHDWAIDFLLQHELGVQAVGSVGRILPKSVEEGVRSFTRFMKKQVGTQGFGLGSVGAFDEVAVFINLQKLNKPSSLSSAFSLTDPGEPIIDVVLSAMADGTLLPAMVFLKGTQPSCMAAVPASVLLEARLEGFSDDDRLDLWLAKVWRPYINPSAGGKGLLVMDPYRGHLADDFLASLNSANTLPAVVPKACTCCLQPVETCTGPVLREFLQACWTQQVASAPESLVGAQPDELALLLIGWLAELLQVLGARPDLLQRSFTLAAEPLQRQAREGPTGLVQELTRALLQSNPPGVEEERDTDQTSIPASWPSPSTSRKKLKQAFEKDSDLDSFHGFEESEMGN